MLTADPQQRFTVLIDALDAAELTDTLSAEGPLTLFAPTNDAFDALAETGVELQELLDDPELGDLLLHHTISGQALTADLSNGQRLATVLGDDVRVDIDELTGDVRVNGVALVVEADIEASNGVIHAIDAVLPVLDRGVKVDFSGEFFLAAELDFEPGRATAFRATATVADDLSTIDFVFQPLVNDILPSGAFAPDARSAEGAGAPIVVRGVPYTDRGTFSATLPVRQYPNAVSPSGTSLTVGLTFSATVVSADFLCGVVSGPLVQPEPLYISPEISTLGAQRINDDLEALPLRVSCDRTLVYEDPNAPEPRCPADLEGDYTLHLRTELDDEDVQGTLRLTSAGDQTICATGELLSEDDTVLAEVTSVLDYDGVLQVDLSGYTAAFIPDGGTADLVLRASSWSSSSFLCGALTLLATDAPLIVEGDFAAIDANSPNLTLSGPTCDDIARDEPCGLESLAGVYRARFAHQSQSENTEVRLVIEANPATCLSGRMERLSEPGTAIARLVSAEEGEGGLPVLELRELVIGPGEDPLLPNGGRANMTFTATVSPSDGAYCGDLTYQLYEPISLGPLDGSFSFALEDAELPVGPACPAP